MPHETAAFSFLWEKKDVGPTQLLFPVIVINLNVTLPFFGHFVFGKDCFNGANGYAGAAINAHIRIDIQLDGFRKTLLIFPWVNTIDRADIHAGRILNVYAGFGNDKGHNFTL
jgi:hypothetical protein